MNTTSFMVITDDALIPLLMEHDHNEFYLTAEQALLRRKFFIKQQNVRRHQEETARAQWISDVLECYNV